VFGYCEGIELAQDHVQWRVLVLVVLNLGVLLLQKQLDGFLKNESTEMTYKGKKNKVALVLSPTP
jgi:hypothetical protein